MLGLIFQDYHNENDDGDDEENDEDEDSNKNKQQIKITPDLFTNLKDIKISRKYILPI